MDVLDTITGEFLDELIPRRSWSFVRTGACWFVAGCQLMGRFNIKLDKDRDHETTGGLIIEEMGQLPKVGDHIGIRNWRIEVVDLYGRRIDRLLTQARQAP